METIAVSELRRNLMALIKKVQRGKSITVTSRGHEVAMLIPVKGDRNRSKEALKKLGESAVIGDVVSPLEEEWKALK